MKVIHLSASDSGGAGRAALRLHMSLLKIGVKSELWVDKSTSKKKFVVSPSGKIKKFIAPLRRYTKTPLIKLLKTKNPILHSPAFLPSSWIKKLNKSDADIINLHWVQHEMLSITDIAKIEKPLVWTLHDMWAFCGAEHIAWDKRWQIGYNKYNRPSHEKGFDLNRWTWLRKKRYWKNSIQIITPSKWLTKCAKNSKLMRKWPVLTIPNSIDTNFWKPVKKLIKKKYKFKEKVYVLAFGSHKANEEYHKGFDLLLKAIKKIKKENKLNLKLVIFGENKFKKLDWGFPVQHVGYLKDRELKKLYIRADAVVVPSRQESFGQIASEASACQTPVIAFNTSGLKDIINHRSTGYLAKKNNVNDLSKGINWVLTMNTKTLGLKARNKVERDFNSDLIAKKYLKTYSMIL